MSVAAINETVAKVIKLRIIVLKLWIGITRYSKVRYNPNLKCNKWIPVRWLKFIIFPGTVPATNLFLLPICVSFKPLKTKTILHFIWNPRILSFLCWFHSDPVLWVFLWCFHFWISNVRPHQRKSCYSEYQLIMDQGGSLYSILHFLYLWLIAFNHYLHCHLNKSLILVFYF